MTAPLPHPVRVSAPGDREPRPCSGTVVRPLPPGWVTSLWAHCGLMGEIGSSTGLTISQVFIHFLSISVVGKTLILGTKS